MSEFSAILRTNPLFTETLSDEGLATLYERLPEYLKVYVIPMVANALKVPEDQVFIAIEHHESDCTCCQDGKEDEGDIAAILLAQRYCQDFWKWHKQTAWIAVNRQTREGSCT